MQRPKSGASRRHRLALVPGYRPETGQSPSPAQTPRLELYAFAAPASCAEAVTVPPRKPHWRRCRRLKWSLGHWNGRHSVSAVRRPGCCAAADRWTEAVTRFLVLWAVIARNRLRPSFETADRQVSGNAVFRPQCRMRGWLLVENSTVEIFGSASLGVLSAFHPGPKPLEAGAAGPVHYWLSGASALNRSTS